MLKTLFFFTTFLFLFICNDLTLFAQQKTDSTRAKENARVDMPEKKEDTILIKANNKADTSGKNLLALDTTVKKHNPKIATFRSAVLPGWGQAYNRKYWKIPIIYGALGTTAGIFLYNLKTYKLLKKAVILRSDTIPGNDNQIDPQFRDLSTEAIRTYRNSFRQNIDYSVLFFLIFWGLNVVDATVDAHLKAFDVSPNITMKIRPSINYMNNGAGLSLVFSFKDNHSKIAKSVP
ncbi:MAG: DUF5683 domain-containing protein [Bacteroidota bacterium]|nr:DUF5683 domain-containing protein [Bacteroidota bacterium]